MKAVVAEEPDWNWRDVDFPVELMFPTRGVRELAGAQVQLKSISEGGAIIAVGFYQAIPDFFYLQLNSESGVTTGCHTVEKSKSTIRCEFLKELTSLEVDRIIAEQEIKAIFDALEKKGDEDDADGGALQQLLRML